MPTEYTIDAKPPPQLPPPHKDSEAVGVSESGVFLNDSTIPMVHMPVMHHQKHVLEAQTGPTTKPSHDSKGNSTTKRKRTSHYTEPTGPLPQGLPYNISDYPELQLDSTADHSKLVHAFKEPIFYNKPSQVLTIAYSHHTAAVEERKRIRSKKKATLHELQDIRKEFMTKKQELLDMNTKLKASSQKVGQWTNKVFELELKEPNCLFNDKLHKLQNYVNKHGKIPENHKKIHGSGEEKEIAAFVSNVRNKVKKEGEDCAMVAKYPHRKKALEECGIQWESEHDTRFETMFNKLLEYKREHGTFRMPSTDLIKESGDKELIELRNWVFSQVNVFRYHLQGKKVEHVKRFIDAGFSFEHYYATAGHVYDRDTPPFDAICKRFVANGGIVDPDDAKLLEAASNKSPKKGKKRGPNKKKRKKKGDDIQEVEKLKLDGDTVDAMGTGEELDADETCVVAKTEEAEMEVAVAKE